MVWEINARNKSDAIHQVCMKLKERGDVPEAFEEKICRREARTVTSIGNRMAVLHVFDECIAKEFIAVVRLKHRILWEKEDRVDVLFVMAARPGNASEASGFLLRCKELYEKYSKIPR